jgi:glycosyltransferase involved in cell wall biosynthesis
VALVHDYLNQMGGAERVLAAFHALFPAAPVYTTIARPDRLAPELRDLDLRLSFLQKLPGVLNHHQAYLPLYPLAIERMDLRAYDLILSDSSAFAKAAITRPDALHLCYCHTPMRWAWHCDDYLAREQMSPLLKHALRPLMAGLRRWDVATASRVDHFMANSDVVAARIRQHYGRVARVIAPPINMNRFPLSTTAGDYFLILSRLAPYKRIDLAVQACTRLGLPLRIVGGGRDLARLQRLAGPTVTFLGNLTDAAAQAQLAGCRALIFPGEEDFGIAPLEAQACGKPVIAFGAGGALTTVIPGRTGLLFPEQTVASLMAALHSFRVAEYSPVTIRRHAAAFDITHFHRRVAAFITEKSGLVVALPAKADQGRVAA